MNNTSNTPNDLERTSGINWSGQGRFILLILIFNVLLIMTLILSMRQRELIEEYELVVKTRIIVEEQVITQEAIKPVTITLVVEPGFTPQPTLSGQ